MEPAMQMNMSIKGVPVELVAALRERARENHRSLQGELMAMLEAHVGRRPFKARALLDRVRALGVRTTGDADQLVRDDRDRR